MKHFLWVCLLACLLGQAEGAEAPKPFEFIVMGCMPYYLPEDNQRFQYVITEVNKLNPAFSVHCGDTKGGKDPCDDPVYDRVLGYFNSFNGPLVYVPGDNEWTDCVAKTAGSYDPAASLQKIRGMFFKEEKSLGKTPLPLVSQRRQPEYQGYPEHNRWEMGGILFTTLHVVGSNNNHFTNNPAAVKEFEARDKASIAWLREAFATAKKENHRALVLFMQANPLDELMKHKPRGSGFEKLVPALHKEMMGYDKPVYLFHSDSHYFRIDKPLLSPTGRLIENFTRVETFGGRNLHLIRVSVDPQAAEPFTVRPWMIEANRVDPSKPMTK
ncbi:MAG: metallophosphoesterase [Verrucomicrobia bacterium]|jgi:hypothetical protein|nr:metallophosphoesterase [Verrucomicrobiota bacterium]